MWRNSQGAHEGKSFILQERMNTSCILSGDPLLTFSRLHHTAHVQVNETAWDEIYPRLHHTRFASLDLDPGVVGCLAARNARDDIIGGKGNDWRSAGDAIDARPAIPHPHNSW